MVLSKVQQEKALKIVAAKHFGEWLKKGCRPYVRGRQVIYLGGNKLVVKTFENEKNVADFLTHYKNQHPEITLSTTCLAIMDSYNVGQLNESQKRQIANKRKRKQKK